MRDPFTKGILFYVGVIKKGYPPAFGNRNLFLTQLLVSGFPTFARQTKLGLRV